MYLQGKHKGLRLVPKGSEAPSPFFRVGEEIPESGVYRVFHAEHRVSHQVLLLAGEKFPRCSQCGSDVHFELLQRIPEIAQDADFIRVYEIPHPEQEGKQGKVSA